MEEQFYVIVFESTHYAIAAEKLFKDKGYKFDIIPTPRQITHSCGLSIRFIKQDTKDIEKQMKEAKIIIKGIYEMQKISNEKRVKKIV